MSNHANRLANEKSPYLLQHARNPVDWHPWGDEAFEKARREDKPVFLSIGYSTCHWCHVMAHESFEDPEVGRLMNDIFVPVKVDREERPDIDAVYMAVCQMLTGSGGWPLTVIMTPGQEPFFAGTYFPRRSRGGRIGMIELAGAIRELWKNRRHEATAGAGEIVAALRRLSSAPPGGRAGEEEAHRAFTELKDRYDPAHGGFGGRPKFPMPGTLLFLFRYWHRNGAREALDMAVSTLEAMRRGGIYDHLGFGFHRYSTDAEWRVPHFEKMLYDQALMAMAYTEAHAITGRQDFRDTAREVLEYVIRDLSSPEGGFHSAEDADSEGVEGKFYLWSLDELSRLLHDGERRLFSRVFGITGEGNYRDEASGGATGLNILHMDDALSAAAEGLSMGVDELGAALSEMKRRLYAFRLARVRPHRDDKVLTDWNGLMIAALAVAARLFGEERYAAAARRAADFILARMRDAGGGLLHRYREGESAIPGNLDDYAFFTWGLLELYGAGFEPAYLEAAVELTGDLIRRFRDEGRGGFYFTPEDGQPLIVRPREIYDGALPSGNAVAMMNLLTLGHLTARTEYVELAHGILQGFADSVRQQPSAHSFLMGAMLLALGRSTQIVIVGERDAPDTRRMIDETRRGYRPGAVTMLLTPGNRELMNGIAPFTRSFPDGGGKTVAYVCTDHACSEPTRDLAGSLSRLGLA